MITQNQMYSVNGVTVYEKIIPDNTVWEKDYIVDGVVKTPKGSPYKANAKLSNGTGKVQSITIHNTDGFPNIEEEAKQYTWATYNQYMGKARVHYYVDSLCAWQNLKAGTGMSVNDPEGGAEIGWHAGVSQGNRESLGIEIIMSNSPTNSADDKNNKAMQNGAKLAAWLLWRHNLSINDLVTHTYWVNLNKGNIFEDVDRQCTTLVGGEKWCPIYIMGPSENGAYENWKDFKNLVDLYLTVLKARKMNTCKTCISVRSAPSYEAPITLTLCCCCVCSICYYHIDEDGVLWGQLCKNIGWIPLSENLFPFIDVTF